MIEIYYKQKAFAYCANNGEDEIVLYDNSINFYDGDGVIATIKCQNNISFSLPINKPFSFRKKENFSKNEVFAVRQKKDKYETNAKYKLYVPSKDVNLVNKGKVFNFDCYELIQYNYNSWEIDAINFQYPFFYSKAFTAKDNRLTFREFSSAENTEKGNYLENLKKEIEDLCGMKLDIFTLKNLTEHYNITKKEKKDEQAQNKALP